MLLISTVGCAPVRDMAGEVSGEVGEISDELGGPRELEAGDDTVVIEPAADKKIRMKF